MSPQQIQLKKIKVLAELVPSEGCELSLIARRAYGGLLGSFGVCGLWQRNSIFTWHSPRVDLCVPVSPFYRHSHIGLRVTLMTSS